MNTFQPNCSNCDKVIQICLLLSSNFRTIFHNYNVLNLCWIYTCFVLNLSANLPLSFDRITCNANYWAAKWCEFIELSYWQWGCSNTAADGSMVCPDYKTLGILGVTKTHTQELEAGNIILKSLKFCKIWVTTGKGTMTWGVEEYYVATMGGKVASEVLCTRESEQTAYLFSPKCVSQRATTSDTCSINKN